MGVRNLLRQRFQVCPTTSQHCYLIPALTEAASQRFTITRAHTDNHADFVHSLLLRKRRSAPVGNQLFLMPQRLSTTYTGLWFNERQSLHDLMVPVYEKKTHNTIRPGSTQPRFLLTGAARADFGQCPLFSRLASGRARCG